ncbi:methyltransferase [Aphanizomenon sp. UHCC 0183]|uniref:methyltransferase n=1 Tax=Aphanizomenon sp. UHCC 0183 TaxID=2590028 RepID=UPI001447CDF1|nr:methyltransferase [Aphanizomenon sp. UHCC 0183]MTJ29322.1 methyltransferase [Aphanizomenon sp. UHCC 0183]
MMIKNFTDSLGNSISLSDRTKMQEMIQGFQVMQSIFAATKLGLADILRDGEQSYNELAALTDTDSDALYRLLKALSGVGIFTEIQPGYFQNTSLSTCLFNEYGSMRNYILSQGEIGYACWGELIHSIYTGKSSSAYLYGMERIEYFRQNESLCKIWDGLNFDLSVPQSFAILNAYDFSSSQTIVDIGGGLGVLLAFILHKYSTVKGVLFEQPSPIKRAQDLLTREGLLDRCELVEGDFCESVPGEADVYLLKNVLPMFKDQIAIKILNNCYRVMTKGTKLLVIERVIGKSRWTDNFSNLNSLVLSSGKFRTEDEFRQLLESVGFKIVNIIPTESVISIIECIP